MILGELSILLLPTLHFAFLPILAGALLGGGAAAVAAGGLAAAGTTALISGALAGASVGASVHGAGQAAEAAEEAADNQNEATDRAYQYNLDLWEMEKEQLQRDRDFKYQSVEIQARNELKGAEYRDATALQGYNREMQIKDMEQSSLDTQFQKSNDIYGLQTGFNAAAAKGAKDDELRKYQETESEAAFDKQEARIEYLLAEGRLRSRGVTGRSIDKVNQSDMARFGANMAMLEESVANASRNTRSALAEVDRDEFSANLTAYANKMLDPGVLPEVPVPFATPLTEWQYPDELEEFDYGPKPVKGAFKSPATASQMVWGQALPGIVGGLGQAHGSIFK